MKGAFELFLVLVFGMMFMIMGIDYTGVILLNNQARMMAENTLAILEHQNRLDSDVQNLIDASPVKCDRCNLMLETHPEYPERIWVIVSYPVSLAHLGYQAKAEVKLLSRPLG